MVFDLNAYKSHPNKTLLEHVDGVCCNVKLLTNSKIAELVAIFHDLGKINPNFQGKLNSNSVSDYSNHSYLSSFVFFCAFGCNARNLNKLEEYLNYRKITKNDILAITVLIAKHHGDLPDFEPINRGESRPTILDKMECKRLFNFLDNVKLPIIDYIRQYIEIDDISSLLRNEDAQNHFVDKFKFNETVNKNPIDFYLDNLFTFASLIQADKADAACFTNFIINQHDDISKFCKVFNYQLDNYISTFRQDSDLNRLRTQMRLCSVNNLNKKINDNRIFELTAPTGSGKTLMLLSLAGEIIKDKGPKRIIYGLPFLSITEQVESEVMKIFKGQQDYIHRIDSKSENTRFEKLQNELDSNPSDGIINELNLLEFYENSFAYPFVITTFVRFFETLLSNKNSDLLKLPNFSNSIFLLDEIQSLPPRLYMFFVGYISRFCAMFDSYAIISTATQPNFSIPSDNVEAVTFFSNYKEPEQLLPLEYFHSEVFNRYIIEFEKDAIDLIELKDRILAEDKSTLVILNTINDTQNLYNLLSEEVERKNLILLNTHFTPHDRKLKIYLAKRILREHSKKVIVISTQLIEAGVDIDFPVLYRDFATVSSIVQSAGRCNRNGLLHEKGKVHLFNLSDDGMFRSNLIYRGIDSVLLQFTKSSFIKNVYKENELLSVQKVFFQDIKSKLHIAKHWKEGNNVFSKPDFDFIKDIRQCMFDKIGHFRLIDEVAFGREIQCYVPPLNNKHNIDEFDILLKKQDELYYLIKSNGEINLIKNKKREIGFQLKKMSEHIIVIRLKEDQDVSILRNSRTYYNLYEIDNSCYSFNEGLNIDNSIL